MVVHNKREFGQPAIVSPNRGVATAAHSHRYDPRGQQTERCDALAEMEAVREPLDVEIGMQKIIQRLHQEVGQLDTSDRNIFEMRHIHHLSFEQIARQTGLSPSAVKDRCYSSIDTIRMRMKRRHGRA